MALRSGVWMKTDFLAFRIEERKATFCGTYTEPLLGGPNGMRETMAMGTGS